MVFMVLSVSSACLETGILLAFAAIGSLWADWTTDFLPDFNDVFGSFGDGFRLLVLAMITVALAVDECHGTVGAQSTSSLAGSVGWTNGHFLITDRAC